MKRLCEDTFRGPPEIDGAVCQKKKGHKKRKHRDEWWQNNITTMDDDGRLVEKRAKIVVEWTEVE